MFVFFVPALMFWEYLHLGDQFSSIAEYLSGFAPLMCLAVIASLPDKIEDTSFFTRVLGISSVVASLILIINTVNGGGQSLFSLIQSGFRFGEVEEAEGYQIVYNANQLGYICNIAIVGLLINIYFKKVKKIDYFLIAVLVIIGCLSVSSRKSRTQNTTTQRTGVNCFCSLRMAEDLWYVMPLAFSMEILLYRPRSALRGYESLERRGK